MNDPLGTLVISGQLFIAIPIALLAGFVSFASPCVLPLVPGYLGYISGTVTSENSEKSTKASWPQRRHILTGVSLFVLGFAAVFVAYGAAFGVLGQWVTQWQDLIVRILGVIVIVMGIVFTGGVRFFQRTLTPTWKPATGLGGATLLGIVFGLGWTPCFGPTLIAIQALSLNSGSPWRGALLGFFYCVGLGVPFLLVACGFGWAARSVRFLRTHIRVINIIGGSLLVVTGVLMVTGLWTVLITTLQGIMTGFVPAL